MKKTILTVLLLITSTASYAEDKTKLAEEFYNARGGNEQAAAQDNMDAERTAKFFSKQLNSPCLTNNPKLKNDLQATIKRLDFSQERKKFIIDSYAKKYSADELKQLTTFFSSNLGKKYTKVNVESFNESLAYNTKYRSEQKPEINKQMKELVAKYIDENGQCKTKK